MLISNVIYNTHNVSKLWHPKQNMWRGKWKDKVCMQSNWIYYQLKIDCPIYKICCVCLVLTAKTKPIVDTQNIKELKYTTMDNHECSKKWYKRKRKEQCYYVSARKQWDDIGKSLPINNYIKCKYIQFPNQKTERALCIFSKEETEDLTIHYLQMKLNWESLDCLGHPKARVSGKKWKKEKRKEGSNSQKQSRMVVTRGSKAKEMGRCWPKDVGFHI